MTHQPATQTRRRSDSHRPLAPSARTTSRRHTADPAPRAQQHSSTLRRSRRDVRFSRPASQSRVVQGILQAPPDSSARGAVSESTRPRTRCRVATEGVGQAPVEDAWPGAPRSAVLVRKSGGVPEADRPAPDRPRRHGVNVLLAGSATRRAGRPPTDPTSTAPGPCGAGGQRRCRSAAAAERARGSPRGACVVNPAHQQRAGCTGDEHD